MHLISKRVCSSAGIMTETMILIMATDPDDLERIFYKEDFNEQSQEKFRSCEKQTCR
jgi:hypothetical protein